VFRYSLSILKIYSARYVYYRFSVLAVNIETQPVQVDATAIVTFRLVSSQFPRSASIFVISGREVAACSVPSAFSAIDIAISTNRAARTIQRVDEGPLRVEVSRVANVSDDSGPMLTPRLEGIAMAAVRRPKLSRIWCLSRDKLRRSKSMVERNGFATHKIRLKWDHVWKLLLPATNFYLAFPRLFCSYRDKYWSKEIIEG